MNFQAVHDFIGKLGVLFGIHNLADALSIVGSVISLLGALAFSVRFIRRYPQVAWAIVAVLLLLVLASGLVLIAPSFARVHVAIPSDYIVRLGLLTLISMFILGATLYLIGISLYIFTTKVLPFIGHVFNATIGRLFGATVGRLRMWSYIGERLDAAGDTSSLIDFIVSPLVYRDDKQTRWSSIRWSFRLRLFIVYLLLIPGLLMWVISIILLTIPFLIGLMSAFIAIGYIARFLGLISF